MYDLCLKGLEHPSPELRAMLGELTAEEYLSCFIESAEQRESRKRKGRGNGKRRAHSATASPP
jgi:hypothetical protein